MSLISCVRCFVCRVSVCLSVYSITVLSVYSITVLSVCGSRSTHRFIPFRNCYICIFCIGFRVFNSSINAVFANYWRSTRSSFAVFIVLYDITFIYLEQLRKNNLIIVLLSIGEFIKCIGKLSWISGSNVWISWVAREWISIFCSNMEYLRELEMYCWILLNILEHLKTLLVFCFEKEYFEKQETFLEFW